VPHTFVPEHVPGQGEDTSRGAHIGVAMETGSSTTMET